jgi:hypothetical protein
VRYLVIWLGKQNVPYHYCDIPPEVVEELRTASSMGRYYNDRIKGNFDCRTHPIPEF